MPNLVRIRYVITGDMANHFGLYNYSEEGYNFVLKGKGKSLEKEINRQCKGFSEKLVSSLEEFFNVGEFKCKEKPKMAKLKAAKRDKIPASEFGLPGSRKYPMPDKSHAANAKSRATQMVKKGKLSESSKKKIDAKANKVLGR